MFGEMSRSLKFIDLPNATTWTCMVFVLIVMLFVRFARPFQWRHWDLLLLFSLSIPLLFLRDSQERRDDVLKFLEHPEQLAPGGIYGLQQIATAPLAGQNTSYFATAAADYLVRHEPRWQRYYGIEHHAIWRSYLWLLIVSAGLLFRSLMDLGLDQRREFRSNVTTGGMLWLMVVMLVVMVMKAYLPAWRGIPQPQNETLFVKFLSELLNSTTVVPHTLALLCQTLIVVHLVLIGWLHFGNLSIGAAAGLIYLLMPYTAILLLNTSQVIASVFIVIALTWYRSPILAGLFLGLGTGFGFFPAILVPAWLGFYFRRGHGRFLFTYLMVIAGFVTFLSLYIGLHEAWMGALSLAEWQAWKFAIKPTADGLWNSVSLHGAYRIPLLIAFVALMITSAFWPHPKNFGQLIAWSATLILGLQFWYADAGGSHILWYLPLVILLTVRPSLTDLRAARIHPEHDRLTRILKWLGIKRDPVAQAPTKVELPPPSALAG